LTIELAKFNLILDPKKGLDTGNSGDLDETDFNLPQWLALAAIIVGSILLIMVVFLGIAYKLRVSS
jgi:hypothetical protein